MDGLPSEGTNQAQDYRKQANSCFDLLHFEIVKMVNIDLALFSFYHKALLSRVVGKNYCNSTGSTHLHCVQEKKQTSKLFHMSMPSCRRGFRKFATKGKG